MRESIRQKLHRVRPPRVQITYDVETEGAIEKNEIPIVVAVMADLSAMPAQPLPPIKERKFSEIDRDNFDQILSATSPRLCYSVPNVLPGVNEGSSLKVDLQFSELADFDPASIVSKVEPLAALYVARNRLRDLLTVLEGNDALLDAMDSAATRGILLDHFAEASPEKWVEVEVGGGGAITPLLKQMLEQGVQQSQAVKMLGQFVADCLVHAETSEADVSVVLPDRITAIDQTLSLQLNAVMHDAHFQQLESCWRGLQYLVMNSDTGGRLKIRVLNANLAELLEDINRAVEFDQSALFKMLIDAEVDSHGGVPYSLLVGDYEFGCSEHDRECLDKVAALAAATHAPFIAAAAVDSHSEDSSSWYKTRELSEIFSSADLNSWESFHESENSRFVSLTLPQVLLRLPWGGEQGNLVEGFDYVEDVSDPAKFLWGNAAYMLAQRIANAFSLHGWPAAFQGIEGGGRIENLSSYTFATEEGASSQSCVTEFSIAEGSEEKLSSLGFMPICQSEDSSKVAFFGGQASEASKSQYRGAENANAKDLQSLPSLLSASRFVQTIKVILREKRRSFLSKQNIEDFLNSWISDYVLLDDNATEATQARYPLREARISVIEDAGNPGAYLAELLIRPHFQLEHSSSIKLTVEVSA